MIPKTNFQMMMHTKVALNLAFSREDQKWFFCDENWQCQTVVQEPIYEIGIKGHAPKFANDWNFGHIVSDWMM